MIDTLDIQSEMVPPLGGMPGSGLLNSLGRQEMPLHELILREAVQNSWDARLPGDPKVRFLVSVGILDSLQGKFLRSTIFKSVPMGLERMGGLVGEAGAEIATLIFSDRGTVGLTGPTRADEVGDTCQSNFVNFLRDFGRPKQEENCGGGTYGFGRSALFLASKSRCLIVHSHFRNPEGIIGRRFMAAALGREYVLDRGPMLGRYTGRHWWGRISPSGGIHASRLVEPVEGNDADWLAGAIGMPRFVDEETGTSIMIVDPENGLAGLQGLAIGIARSIPWYFWPKMAPQPSTGSSHIEFEVTYHGERVPVKAPTDDPQLKYYCQALASLKTGNSTGYPSALILDQKIVCGRPRRDLGRLIAVQVVSTVRALPADERDDASAPFAEPQHHVALLRSPELVVKYLKGPSRPDGLEYCAVFRAEDEMNDILARSETPTHGDWVPDSRLERNEQTFVRVSLRRIGDVLRQWVTPPPVSPGLSSSGYQALGDFSKYLAELIPGASAGGESSRPEGSGTGGTTERRWRIAVHGQPMLCIWRGHRAAKINFRMSRLNTGETAKIGVQIAIAVDDGLGAEQEAPYGANSPQVLCWVKADGAEIENAQDLVIGDLDILDPEDDWSVIVEMPEDTSITVDVLGRLLRNG